MVQFEDQKSVSISIFLIAQSQPCILAAWDEGMKPSQDSAIYSLSSFLQRSNMTSSS